MFEYLRNCSKRNLGMKLNREYLLVLMRFDGNLSACGPLLMVMMRLASSSSGDALPSLLMARPSRRRGRGMEEFCPMACRKCSSRTAVGRGRKHVKINTIFAFIKLANRSVLNLERRRKEPVTESCGCDMRCRSTSVFVRERHARPCALTTSPF